MIETAAALLVVDSDREFGGNLVREAVARSYRATAVGSVDEAIGLIRQDQQFDAVLVDLAPGADAAFELLSRLRQMAADTEVLLMSDRSSIGAAIHWFDPEAFAFVRKSDPVQLFAAVGRALERRRITLQNRRLVWELQTINDIVSGITQSLEIEDVAAVALQRLVGAMGVALGSIRLRDELTGVFELSAVSGSRAVCEHWPERMSGVPRPSDQVIATRAAVTIEDFESLVPAAARAGGLPVRSAICLPLLAGDALLGTLSLGASTPRRFQAADERLLGIIAGQMVVAIQNAQLHHSIRRAKREWEQTFDAISDPIAVFNSRGQLLRANRALAAHLAVPVQAIRALTCADVGFCGGEAPPDCSIGQAFGQQPSRSEVTLADGQIFSVTTFPMGRPSEGPSVVQVAKNVTEEIHGARRLQQMSHELAGTNGRLMAAMEQLKSTQAQLLQSEKLSAIGHLVSGVAHELNNPLTSVIGYSQLVEEELRDGPSDRHPGEVAQDLRRIAEEAERAARIVRNLLAFARRQSVARQPQDLCDVCSRVIALRDYEFKVSGVELTMDFPERLPQVLADGGQLQQVLLNLILNAERAMRGRQVRRLSLSARHDEDAGAVELCVTDSGHGIEAGNLSRIFDPFFTTRDVGEGSGLGLSICYGIVRDHGGYIRVESRARVGTSFRVTLPARLSDPAVATTGVLVAHAEQGEREFVAAALSGWGYPVLTAGTAAEALETCLRPSVQIAVVDRSIVAADLGAWRAVRSGDGRQVALVVTSMTPDDRAIEQFGREQASAVLAPPLELRALHAAVRAGSKECV
jgi:two-component system NtrC family sensor kinase